MAVGREQLDRWVEAALLTREQAEAIQTFEATHSDAAPPSGAAPRTGALAETIGYVGAALALGAVVALLGRLWDDLATAGRLTLVGLLMLVLAGAASSLRNLTSPAMTRLTSTLWAGASLTFGWFVGLVAREVVGADPDRVALSVGLAIVVSGIPVLVSRPSVPAQLVVLGGAVTVAISALLLPVLDPDAFWSGLLVWSIGVAWATVGHGRWIRPTVPAQVLGGGLALVATQFMGAGSWRAAGLTIGVLTATALVGLALRVDGLHYLVLGAIGLFVSVPQLVFELFGDAISAPAALLVIGLLLVLLAVGLGRAGREVRRHGPGGAPDATRGEGSEVVEGGGAA